MEASDIISIIALVLAGFGFLLSVLQEIRHRKDDKPKLKIVCKEGVRIRTYDDFLNKDTYFSVEVSNIGKISTTIKKIGIKINDKGFALIPIQEIKETHMPRYLNSGEISSAYVAHYKLQWSFDKEGISVPFKYKAFVDTERKTYYSKELEFTSKDQIMHLETK